MNASYKEIAVPEKQRLQELYAYEILDSEAEEEFNDIVQMASKMCHTPISAISLIDIDRQWFKAQKGLTVSETPREHAFCHYTIQQNDVLNVPDAAADERFQHNPLVQGEPHIRFYAGVPLRSQNGYKLGSLCVIDTQPRERLSENEEEALRVLGRQVSRLLDLRLKNKLLENDLEIISKQKLTLQRADKMREELIQIISHDMRAPLQNMESMIHLIEHNLLNPEELQIALRGIKEKVNHGKKLLSDLLVWAEAARNNASLSVVQFDARQVMQKELEHLSDLTEGKDIELEIQAPRSIPMTQDVHILGFALRNILTNAAKYTEKGKISLRYKQNQEGHYFSIADTGIGMGQEDIQKVLANQRLRSRPGTREEKGTGLGLMIVKRYIEKAKGTLHIESAPNAGTFVSFTLPELNNK